MNTFSTIHEYAKKEQEKGSTDLLVATPMLCFVFHQEESLLVALLIRTKYTQAMLQIHHLQMASSNG